MLLLVLAHIAVRRAVEQLGFRKGFGTAPSAILLHVPMGSDMAQRMLVHVRLALSERIMRPKIRAQSTPNPRYQLKYMH